MWPHIPPEHRDQLVLTKARNHEEPQEWVLGIVAGRRSRNYVLIAIGEIRTSLGYFRHTGITFAVARKVPHLPLAKFAERSSLR